MLIIYLTIAVLSILFCILLYACMHISSPYDRKVDDEQQELFLTAFRSKQK